MIHPHDLELGPDVVSVVAEGHCGACKERLSRGGFCACCDLRWELRDQDNDIVQITVIGIRGDQRCGKTRAWTKTQLQQIRPQIW